MIRFQKFVLLFVSLTFIFIMVEHATRNPKNDIFYSYNKLRSNKPTKYLLLWNMIDWAPLSFLGKGNEVFLKNRCPFSNCFVTSRRDFFGENLSKFDAIAFNGRSIKDFTSSDLPEVRYSHQKYIFFNMESSVNELVCNPLFDGFFNWTATYKLNSDILFAYILIKNTSGHEVGPRTDMMWNEVDDDNVFIAKGKTKTAVWMVSHCYTKSKREKYAEKLKEALKAYGHTIDIYGSCGNLKCPRYISLCDKLPSEYYFYLAFENSIAEDYVTEKVYTAVKNDAVPIVFGGANYSRFLPPGSFLDAMKHSPEQLATIMVSLIKDPSVYKKFFKWRNHYTYHLPQEAEDLCRVCTALNDKTMMETSKVYKRFRFWWNPYYRKQCPGNQ